MAGVLCTPCLSARHGGPSFATLRLRPNRRRRTMVENPPRPVEAAGDLRRAGGCFREEDAKNGFPWPDDRVHRQLHARLRRAVEQLAKGDVLMVTRLDRLARSTRDLLNTLAAIADKGAGFRSLGDAWADTTTPHGRLMLTVLGGLAEFERELIRARTGEGRERAKARGVKLGRKPKLTDHQKKEAIRRRDRGEETLAEIGRSYNVSGWTIARLVP